MGIKKCEDGTYTVSYSKRHPITRRPYNLRRTKIESKAKARRVYDELVIQINKKFEKQITPYWQDVVRDFLEDYLNRGIQKSTVLNYKYGLKTHTFELWKNKPISKITTGEIRSIIIDDLREKSESTRKNLLKYIRAVFNYALENDIIYKNPSPKIKFKVNRDIKKVLNESELKHFLTKAKEANHPWFPVWALACYTGLRNGELIAARWENFDWTNRMLIIRESWSRYDGFKETKSGHDRIVEISEDLIPILQDLKKENSEFILPRIEGWQKNEQSRILKSFLTEINLPEIRFHDLRASWCTLLLSKGVEPVKVMSMGGWRDLKTLQIYLRKAGISIRGISSNIRLL